MGATKPKLKLTKYSLKTTVICKFAMKKFRRNIIFIILRKNNMKYIKIIINSFNLLAKNGICK